MAGPTREMLERELKRFGLAESDMLQVAVGVGFLLEHPDVSFELRRILETGIVVTYARPFTDSAWLGMVDRRKWAPKEAGDRELHDEILKRRDKVYAHTDSSELRQVHGPHAIVIEDASGRQTALEDQWSEQYQPLKSDELERLQGMSEALAERMRDAWLARRESIRNSIREMKDGTADLA